MSRITDFTVPGQFAEEEGSLDSSQTASLEQIIEEAIFAGGLPADFTHHLARRAGFDGARITAVLELTVTVGSVRVERRSGDLWVLFTAEAVCTTDLESFDVIDEDAGECVVERDSAAWVLGLEGTAVSAGADFHQVAALRLTSIDGDDGDDNYAAAPRSSH